MSIKSIIYKGSFVLFLSLFGGVANAQTLKNGDVKADSYPSENEGRAVVTSVTNNSKVDVKVYLINDYDDQRQTIDLKAGATEKCNITCTRVSARYNSPSGGGSIKVPVSKSAGKVDAPPLEIKQDEGGKVQDSKDEDGKSGKTTGRKEMEKEYKPLVMTNKKKEYDADEVIGDFNNYIESLSYYSIDRIEKEKTQVEEHVSNLKNWKDRSEYIREHHLVTGLKSMRDTLNQKKADTDSLINDYLDRFVGSNIKDKDKCIDSMESIVAERLQLREANINRLSEELGNDDSSTDLVSTHWKLIALCGGIAVTLLILVVFFEKARRKKRKPTAVTYISSGTDAASAPSSQIIVRRKTTSILRKQSLEDVIGNDSYLKIDCKDFCDDSAVRRMYIKNTCIKDIYNMYAEDLRNPDNPKEDGCMVLGRWVYDDEAKEYYVSLEYIVRPGDDAVFSEYELNFGGKIKLKVTEKLRKLRRETNLQYDLTCWVHSHPGLGVFFSNSDNNVQAQLKSPSHPDFLTAIVVDILTPQQEMGIFTFKHDSVMNSKAELKKMYSLEELYKWAVESERNSFKPADYYNALSEAGSHLDKCYGIELSNGAIIDMGMLATEQPMGFVGKVYGYDNRQGLRTEYVVNAVPKGDEANGNDLIGCFVIATHCSIPSIRKAVAVYMNAIRFVLVYTPGDGLLTSIPVVDNNLCTDVKYYGEQKLEDLKIWTRRKR